jgi:hypothetical protein
MTSERMTQGVLERLAPDLLPLRLIFYLHRL